MYAFYNVFLRFLDAEMQKVQKSLKINREGVSESHRGRQVVIFYISNVSSFFGPGEKSLLLFDQVSTFLSFSQQNVLRVICS